MKKNLTNTKQLPTKRGPAPDTLKIDIPWEEAAARLVKTKKPAGGWPDARPAAKKKAKKK